VNSGARTQPVVAIDGPAGAGKSTVSRRAAEELGYVLLDTGAIYRCVGLAALRAGHAGVGPQAMPAIVALTQALVARHAIRFEQGDGQQRVLLDDEDVSSAIRTQEIGDMASRVSAIGEVREALLDLQRQVGAQGGVVVEGRDIGSVVFPDAEAKFFLTASVLARAARRHAELQHGQPELSLETVQQQVEDRDRRDSARPVAPLLRAPDAELLDSTNMTIDQVVARIVSRVREIEAGLGA
jgi:CMP/dCMP kinase